MKKILFCTIIFCFFSLFINAQDTQKSVITLKNGTILSGEIVVQTENTVIFKTEDGTRYQFPAEDVEKIENTANDSTTKKPLEDSECHYCMTTNLQLMADVNNGFYFKNSAFSSAYFLSASMILGFNRHNQVNDNFYYGLGAGYENVFTLPQNINLLKIFFRIQKQFTFSPSLSPFTSLDVGVSSISNKGWAGGIFAKATGGISIKLSQENFLFFGLNLGVQGCNTTLLETRDGIIYRYKGTTFLPAAAISAAIMF